MAVSRGGVTLLDRKGLAELAGNEGFRGMNWDSKEEFCADKNKIVPLRGWLVLGGTVSIGEMKMYVLKSLSLSDGRDIYEMLQEIGSNENGFHNKVNGMSFSQFKDWLAKEYAVDNGELEAWMVPQSSYWMYDGAIPVGTAESGIV